MARPSESETGEASVRAALTPRIGLFAGPIAALAVQAWPLPPGLSSEAWLVLSLAVLMVIWWVSEALPAAVTSLLPLAFVPILGVADIEDAAAPYADPAVFLLLAGFMIGLAVTRWRLHERLALIIAVRTGGKKRALVAGFMLAAALIALWISSAATTLMLAPVAFGAARIMSDGEEIDLPLGGALLLGVAYAAAIGAIGTPISSPINLAAIEFLARAGQPISVLEWAASALPIMILLLPLAWLLLTAPLRDAAPAERERAFVELKSRLRNLGPMSAAETRLAFVFGAVIFLWMFRPLIAFAPGLEGLSDAGVAVAGVIALFLAPAGGGEKSALLDWRTAERIPWNIIVMFGGGLALASAMEASGLVQWLGEVIASTNWITLWGLVAALVTATIFLCEIASNVAILLTMLPIIAAVAAATGVDLKALAFPVALAASFSFMLPVTAAPNAIAYATGLVSWRRMLAVGLIMNVAAIAAIVVVTRLIPPG